MRPLFAGQPRLFILSGIIWAFWGGYFSFPVVFASPTELPPQGTSYIEAGLSAPGGSLVIAGPNGAITAGVWQGTIIDMLYGGTGFNYDTASGARAGLGVAESGANTDIVSLLGTGALPTLALVPNSGNAGIGGPATNTLSVGGGLFEVDGSGDLKKINGVAYSWPSDSGVINTLLTNDGSGLLSWSLPVTTASAGGWTLIDNPSSDDIVHTTVPTRKVGIGTALPQGTLHVMGLQNTVGGSAPTENPLASQDTANTVFNPDEYEMGYRFTPLVDGIVTQLGARCDAGQRAVKLYNQWGELLASTTVTNVNENIWAYSDINQVNVYLSQSYIVAVRNESTPIPCPPLPDGFTCSSENRAPQNHCGGILPDMPVNSGNIVINEGRQNQGPSVDPAAFPEYTSSGGFVYGQADITFRPNLAGGAPGTASLAISDQTLIGTSSGSGTLSVGGIVSSTSGGLKFPNSAIIQTTAVNSINGYGDGNTVAAFYSPREIYSTISPFADNGNIGLGGIWGPTHKFELWGNVIASKAGNVYTSGSSGLIAASTSGCSLPSNNISFPGAIVASSCSTSSSDSAVFGAAQAASSGPGLLIDSSGNTANFYSGFFSDSHGMVISNSLVGINGQPTAGKLEVQSSDDKALRIRGTGGGVDVLPAVGDLNLRTGIQLCQATASQAICLSQWKDDGSSLNYETPARDKLDPSGVGPSYVVAGTEFGDYNRGFRFTPAVSGKITQLGLAGINGPYTVRLYSYPLGTLLASASVPTEPGPYFKYANINPVSVVAGTSYVVAVRSNQPSCNGLHNCFVSPGDNMLFTIGNITINDSRSMAASDSMPNTVFSTYYFIGIPDITFVPDGAGAGCSENVTNGRALCADFGD